MLKKLLVLVPLFALLAMAGAETIPAGTKITVRTSAQISSKTATVGQKFDGALTHDLKVGGKTIAKAGDPVKGKVTFAKSSGRLHDSGELTLRLSSVRVNGKMVPISTTAFHAKGKSHTKGNVTKIGGGAAAGALIGALAGGGKGAAIGAGVGAGAGTGVAAATGKEEAVVPAESALTFTTSVNATIK